MRVAIQFVCKRVFGEGSQSAKILLISKQPGDEEDQTGKSVCGRGRAVA